GWLAWDAAYPIYYDDMGNGEADLYYDESSPQYAAASPTPPPQGDWMPLGVFPAAKTATQAAYSNMYVQLALNRNGDVSGTYYNASTDKAVELVGSVDSETQQATWQISDNPNSPTMVAGLYNLTQDVAPVQVVFPNNSQQNWVLVRIEQ